MFYTAASFTDAAALCCDSSVYSQVRSSQVLLHDEVSSARKVS
jgi:hypothetical protein